MKVFVVADAETYLAFALAGIAGCPVASATEVPAILDDLSRQEAGLVLITEALAEKNRAAVERILLEPGGPLILEIPAAGGPVAERTKAIDRILSLLRR